MDGVRLGFGVFATLFALVVLLLVLVALWMIDRKSTRLNSSH